MSKLVEIMKGKKNFFALTGANDKQIALAQTKLGVTFSDDYKEYVSAVGVASFDGHELTGICASPRLDVVSVTERNKGETNGIAPSWYVLEELNIDQIAIWQDGDGCVYSASPNSKPVKIAQSIVDYISQ